MFRLTRVRPAVAAILLLLSTLSIITFGATPASAAPDLDVTVSSDDSVLIGEAATVAVEITNNTATPGYNTGVAVVLPSGVSFAGGAFSPQVLADTPAAGQTTLWFENVNDSQPASTETLTFTVAASTGGYPVGSDFTISATAYTSDDPRVVPTSDGTGSTGTGTDSSDTDVIAITIEKEEPSPEAELMRGIHDHDTVYTLTIENNPTNPTGSVIVDDYLPAGLEFLGCGTVDNTTDAPTFAGNNVEYSGAARLDVSTDDIATDCPTPILVETVQVDPDGAGPLPNAVYTHVRWDMGNFATGETKVINYAAGIPIRENTLFTTSPDTVGQQTANLDNNSGAETTDEQELRNHSIVAGTYSGPLASGASNPVGDTDDHIVTAEDIRLLKSVNPTNITQGTDSLWTLTISTSEYRTADDIVVTDTLPDGHCPLSTGTNYDTGEADCAPGSVDPSLPYSSVAENADGTWTIVWNNVPDMGASADSVITFPSRVRTYYQENGADADPVVTNDGFTNTATMVADDRLVAGIPADETDDQSDPDSSSATQSAALPTMEKTISVPAAPGATLDCATATYIDADDLGSAPFAYRPGDIVCYTLRVEVPANLTFRNALVSDFLPAGVTYLADLGPTANNDLAGADVNGPLDFNDGTAAAVGDDTLMWEIGTTVGTDGARYLPISSAARTWEVRFTAEFTGAPTGDGSSLEKANLMKLTTQNTAGAAISQRDQATFIAVEPELTIDKSTTATVVQGGDDADYTVTVSNVSDVGTNAGYARAEDITVTDDLPAPFVCGDLTIDTVAGVTSTCVGSQIEWTIAGLDAGASIDLTYTLAVPDTIAPAQNYDNTATITAFSQTNNESGTTNYTPGVTDDARITSVDATVEKLQRSAVSEAGNIQNGSLATTDDEATIGETVSYEVSVDIPEGITIYNGYFLDALPPDMTLTPGSVTATFDDNVSGGPAAATVPTGGFTINSSNDLRVDFPSTFINADGSGVARIVMTFDATVTDNLNNTRGDDLDNRARLRFQRDAATPAPLFTSSPFRTITVVEPNPTIAKDENIASDQVGPGETITYTLTVTNPANSNGSVAHDMTVVDEIPLRVTPVLPIPDGGVWDPSPGVRTITWTSATTPALVSQDAGGAAITLTYQVDTDDPLPLGGALVNNVDLTATSMAGTVAGERTYTDDASDSLSTAPVSFTKALNPDNGPYTIGEPVDYQIVLTLPEDTITFDTTVTDTLPDGMVFQSATITPSGAECAIVGATGSTITGANADGSTALAFFLGDVTATGADCVFTIDTFNRVDSTYDGTGTPAAGSPVDAGDTLTNSARANWLMSDSGDPTPTTIGDLPGSWDGQSTIVDETITIIEPELVIDKDVATVAGCDTTNDASAAADDDNCTIDPGQGTLTYTLTVENTGDAPAHDITVTDQPDAELRNIVPVTGAAQLTDGWTVGDPDMEWTITGPLAVGGTLTFTYTADLVDSTSLDATSVATNTADVTEYFGLDAADRATSPNERTYGGTFGAVVADTVNLDLDFPTLVIDKTVDDGSESGEAVVGQPFEWRIDVSNTATVADARDVDVADTLPANWTYVAGSAELCDPTCSSIADPAITGTAAAGLQLDWTDVGDIDATESFQLRFDATPEVGALTTAGSGGSINHVNTASATGDDSAGESGNGDGAYASATDTANGVIYEADVRLEKSIVTVGPYLVGQTVDYLVTVTNDGPDAATGVIVDEIIDGTDLLYSATVAVDGSYNAGNGEWTLPASLANGASADLTLRVVINRAGSIVNTAQVVAADRYDPDSTPDNGLVEDDLDSETISAGTASLGSTVWFDVDNSGGDETTKGLEPGFAGVTVNLRSQGNDGIYGNADDFFGPDGVVGGGDDIPVTTLVTDANGNYNFTDLPDGTYQVEIDLSTLPGGATAWTATHNDDAGPFDNRSGDIVLNVSNASYVDADFSFTGTASLGDQVWWDVDRSDDGVYDNSAFPGAQDQPIPGIDVDLTWAGFDGVFGTTDDISYPTDVTDANGIYGFPNLAPGQYRVDVDTNDTDFPAGLDLQTWDVINTGPGGGDGDPTNVVDVPLAAGENRTDVDFSFAGTASLGDTVWLDLDGDGVQDPGEPGIPGVTVATVWLGLDGVPGGGDDITLTTETGGDGTYSFTNLPAGNFTVTVDDSDADFPNGIDPTFDLDGVGTAHTTDATLATGQNRTDVDFGYVGQGSVGDTVWLDMDADGTVNGDEVGIPAAEVTVVWFGADNTEGTADDLVFTTTTDANGNYLVERLPFGDVRVTITPATLPAGVTATHDLDATLDNTTTLTLDGAAPDRRDADFGYRGDAAIGDTVWVDIDGDGTVNAPGGVTETGLDGVDLDVRHAGVDGEFNTADDLVVRTTTSGGGVYGVSSLPAGPVMVTVVSGIPADHANISDPDTTNPSLDADGVWVGTLALGETNLDVDFGYRPDADLEIVKSHTGDFAVGEQASYRMVVTNNGPATAVNVVVTDTLPNGLTYVSATGMACTATGQTVTCTGGDLVAGATLTLDMVVDVSAPAAPSVINTARVDNDTPDRDPSNNVDDDPTVVDLAQLILTKSLVGTSLTPGGTATYRLNVRNDGPSVAEDVRIVDSLPADLTYVSSSGTGWSCTTSTANSVVCSLFGALGVNGSSTVDLVVRVSSTASGSIINRATVETTSPQTIFVDDTSSVLSSVVPSTTTTTTPNRLAFTGSSTGRALVPAGAGLLALGLGLLLLRRRRGLLDG